MRLKEMAIFSVLLIGSGVMMAQTQDANQPTAVPAQTAPATTAPAQTTPAQQGGNGARQTPDPARQTKMLSMKLGLTADQSAKLEPVLAARLQKVEALRADTSLTQRERRRQMMAIQQESKKKINAILTPDQQKQSEAIQQQQRARQEPM